MRINSIPGYAVAILVRIPLFVLGYLLGYIITIVKRSVGRYALRRMRREAGAGV